jgi:hypothetical protein
MFWKPDLFPSSGEGEETRSLLGPLERANLSQQLALSNGPNRISVSPHLRTKTDPVSKALCSVVLLEYWTMDRIQKPSNSDVCCCFKIPIV